MDEALATLDAGVGTLGCGCTPVPGESDLLCGTLGALETGKGLSSMVRVIMLSARLFDSEVLAILSALRRWHRLTLRASGEGGNLSLSGNREQIPTGSPLEVVLAGSSIGCPGCLWYHGLSFQGPFLVS